MLEDLLAGLSEADAAAKHGLSERTLQRWPQKGRDEPGGRYGEFAELVDRARIDRELPADDEGPIDEGSCCCWSRGSAAGERQGARPRSRHLGRARLLAGPRDPSMISTGPELAPPRKRSGPNKAASVRSEAWITRE